jgi:hypothetical protein
MYINWYKNRVIKIRKSEKDIQHKVNVNLFKKNELKWMLVA